MQQDSTIFGNNIRTFKSEILIKVPYVLSWYVNTHQFYNTLLIEHTFNCCCFSCSHEKMATIPCFPEGTSFACASHIISNLSSIEAESEDAQAGNHWTGIPYANYMRGMKIKEKVHASGRG